MAPTVPPNPHLSRSFNREPTDEYLVNLRLRTSLAEDACTLTPWQESYARANILSLGFGVCWVTPLGFLAPLRQCFEGVPLAHGPAGALHVQPARAEDPGRDAGDRVLVPVRVDRGRAAEPREEHPRADHGRDSGRTELLHVLPGLLGLHDVCG